MYHVTGTAITVTILYLISFFFYRTGLFSQALHRKIWNTILAITFLFTALAGIFMALQINYKWDIPVIKSILKWHVEAGVALGMTGIFHFFWHLSYYLTLLKSQGSPGISSGYNTVEHFSISSNIFMIGFTSTSVQILLLKELMNITGGYELISGVFLGSWLITSAAGAALAAKSSLNDLKRINLLFAAGPLFPVALILLMTRIFLGIGEVPSFLPGMMITLIILSPFCLISGFAFVRLIDIAREKQKYTPGKSFSIETAGGIVAGIILTLLTSGLLNTYKLLFIVILLFIAYTILTFFTLDKYRRLAVRTVFLLLISAVTVSEPDILMRQLLLPAVKVTETTDTPYGNITKGEYSGEINIYYNQKLLSYQYDITEREENIHYAFLQRKKHEYILLISGVPGSLIPEINKYDVKKVVFVESDPELIRQSAQTPGKVPANMDIIKTDAFRYVRKSHDTFDVVIMLLPPPSTLSLNRFYTTDFFKDMKARLIPGGVFMCSPGPNDNYFNQESIKLYSSIYKSLALNFRNVIPVAGNKLYFIASDNDLSASFCKLGEERNIQNVYVGPAFLSDDLTEARSEEIIGLMDPGIRQNDAQFPIASFHFQTYNISSAVGQKVPAIVLMMLIFVLPVFVVRKKNLLMYFCASSLAGYEIIILLGLQMAVGNMYQLTGLVMAAMMAGLAAGAGTSIRSLNTINLRTKALALLIYYVAIASGFNALMTVRGAAAPVIIILLSVVIPSYVTGHVFRELTISKTGSSAAGSAYSADLAGAASGFIIISGFAVPALGIRNSIILLAGFIFTGILFGRNENNR